MNIASYPRCHPVDLGTGPFGDLNSSQQNIIRVAGITEDTTDRFPELKLVHQAYYDPLTDLQICQRVENKPGGQA